LPGGGSEVGEGFLPVSTKPECLGADAEGVGPILGGCVLKTIIG
jgi:hypothetical protein